MSVPQEMIARIRSISGRVWDVVAVNGDALKVRGEFMTKFAAQAPGFSHGVSGIRLLSVIEDV